mmetsp:Transcript_4446/g.6722  ORF Transcript_4446/g.6722 Transcript_4446/m.6722 type:complete len:377 (-) Transcript_4446:528-1658(-)
MTEEESRRLCLYGREYDAKKWAAAHPGGPQVIESLLRLDAQVQERMFEISHRNPSANLKRLEMYALSPSKAIVDKKDEDKFLDTVRSEVYDYLCKKYPSNPRGEGKLYARSKCLAASMVWALLLLAAAHSNNLIKLYTFSFIAGIQLIVWGLIQFHDASHFAFSGGYTSNRALTAAWAAVAYWPAWLWHAHHVEAHHANTGNYDHDPDLRHGAPFMRKTPVAPRRRYLDLSAMGQLCAMAIAPGMYAGSVLQYAIIRFGIRKSLWKMHALTPPPSNFTAFWEYLLALWYPIWLTLCIQSYGLFPALLATFFYLVGCNATYAANILPDHDTSASHANLAKLINDQKNWKCSTVLGGYTSCCFSKFCWPMLGLLFWWS